MLEGDKDASEEAEEPEEEELPAEEQKVDDEEEKDDSVLDSIMEEIENAHLEEQSYHESEEEDPAQEPIPLILENLDERTAMKLKPAQDAQDEEQEEFSDDSFDEQDFEEEHLLIDEKYSA